MFRTSTTEFKFFKMAKRSVCFSGETFLVPCAGQKRLQGKTTTDYPWICAHEDSVMFSKL